MSGDSIEPASEDAQDVGYQLDGVDIIADTREQEQHKTGKSATDSKMKEHGSTSDKSAVRSWFSIPAPVKRVFDKFPLVAYVENAPPVRTVTRDGKNILYIFTTSSDAVSGQASFNPSCLKWQTYLKIARIPFETQPSNNHASPTGALPFLLEASSKSMTPTAEATQSFNVVPGSKIQGWLRNHIQASHIQDTNDMRYEAFASLLDHRIRKAWLFQLYLDPANEAVVNRLYTAPCSSNPIVQMTIASQLRAAAEVEVFKASARSTRTIRINEAQIMRDADEAFAALSVLLGDEDWFFHQPADGQNRPASDGKPGLFDASMFAYTYLILDSSRAGGEPLMSWMENPLKESLQKYENLVRHRDRILELYY